MANSAPNTNKSQVCFEIMLSFDRHSDAYVFVKFFVTYSKQPHLDGKYTIIGKVIDGADYGGTLDAMEKVPVDGKNRPIHEILMKGVTIHANPIAQKAI